MEKTRGVLEQHPVRPFSRHELRRDSILPIGRLANDFVDNDDLAICIDMYMIELNKR